MDFLPKRTSLVPETAAVLKQWISAGLLSGTLPGELQLKSRLGVGRDTLRLALKLLEREGFVTPASQGRHRQVQTTHPLPTAAVSNTLPVTFLSPFHVVDRITLLEMEDLQRHLTKQGRDLQFLSPDIFNLKNPSRQLSRIVHEHRSAAWILYMVGEAAQQWFDKNGVPAFVYGAPFEGLKLPYTVNDWEAAAFHAGIQLFRHKHRRIGVFEERTLSSGFLSVERGLNRALATIGSKGQLTFFKINPSPASVVHSLEQAFSLKEPPTALMTTGSAQLLTCFSWMISRGIRCPGDISLVSLCSDSWFDELRPPVCHYRCNSKIFARHVSLRVMELVATGRVTRKSVRVRLEYMGGGTIAVAHK